MTDGTGTTTYDYDALYRPLTITAPYAGPVGHHYDAVGNRTVLSTTAGTSGYVYDDADWLLSVDGVACAYDNRGNLLSDGTWT